MFVVSLYGKRSVWTGSTAFTFSVAAFRGKGASLFDGGMLQAVYTWCVPVSFLSTVLWLEFWLESIPSQVRLCEVTKHHYA